MDLSKYMEQFIAYYKECLNQIRNEQSKDVIATLNLKENNQIVIFDESLDVYMDDEQKPCFVHQVKFKVNNTNE